ncbi:MAG: hypothetical protein ACI8XC_004210 [Gammaproteobacteria bacterium]|jgi:hypothetical protein
MFRIIKKYQSILGLFKIQSGASMIYQGLLLGMSNLLSKIRGLHHARALIGRNLPQRGAKNSENYYGYNIGNENI